MERMGGWVQDVSFGVRQIVRRPGFAAIVILTLALGVGATTTIFSVVSGVLLRPLPVADADRLIRVWVGPDRGSMSAPDFQDIQDELPSIRRLVGVSSSSATITGMGEPTLVPASRVSGGLLELFQLAPQAGRDIRADEWGPDAATIAVIGHGLWQRMFGGAADVVGRTITVGGVTREIVGVAPAGFSYPDDTELWYPRQLDPEDCGRGCHTWYTIGTLARGATLETAQAELDGLAAILSETYPESNFDKRFRVVGLQEDMVGDVRRGLWILMGSVAAVLLIACANVANLLMVRASNRSGEMAVRGALGASRGRLVRQTLVESALFAVLGGVFGLLIARFAILLLHRFYASAIPRIEFVTIDGPVLVFTLFIVSLVTVLFGASPALRNSRLSIVGALAHAGRGSQAGAGQRQRRLLVAAEMGLSVVLLVAAGLLLRTFGQLHAVDFGYQTENIVRFSLGLPSAKYETVDQIRGFYRTLETRLENQPGVESVGSVYGAPLGRGNITGDVLVEGRPDPEPGQETSGSIKAVSPHYLATMRIPLRRGRALEPADDVDGVPVAVVSETFARENFGDGDPIGERVRITADFGYGSPYWTIVGVVADIRSRSVTDEPEAQIYVPHGQFGPGFMTVSMRTGASAGLLADAIRNEVRQLDPDLPIRDLQTIEDAIAADVAPTRFYLTLVALFAGLALILAAVGLYGVLAYLVSTRTREIGVRVALGATRTEIARMIVTEGMRPALGGLVVGLLVALMLGRVLEAVLFGVSATDPAVFALVSVVLALVALLAAWRPAARAARLDPSTALRSE
jgi:putative ABC transport system permease protein